MTELEKTLHDMRRDIIQDVADSMPDASGIDVVRAIVNRLNVWRPQLVEVEMRTGRSIMTLEMSEDTAHYAMLAIDDARERRHADDHIDEMLGELTRRISDELSKRWEKESAAQQRRRLGLRELNIEERAANLEEIL